MSAPRLLLTSSDEALLRRRIPELRSLGAARVTQFIPLAQHASTRSYHRLLLEDGPPGFDSLVVMKLGDDPLASDERVEGPRPLRLPFVEIGEALTELGLPTPRVHADWSREGLVLLEDLGDRTFEQDLRERPREGWLSAYREAVALLARFHAAQEGLRQRGSLATRRRFGPSLLAWELSHFREWGLEARGLVPDAGQRRRLEEAFSHIVSRLAEASHGLSHRDYQSRNLMWHEGRLRLIDFQDALIAPVVYDLVALLRDSYVLLTPGEVGALLDDYERERSRQGLPPLDSDVLREDFRWMTVQRKLKDAGRFVFIDRVKGDPSFLRHIPSSLGYVREALGAIPALAGLRETLEQLLPSSRELGI